MKASTKKNIIIVIALTVGATGYRIYSEKYGSRLDERLQNLESQEKKKLPMRVDATTTLVDIKYERTNNIYWYELDQASDVAFDVEKVKQSVSAKICANAEMARTIKTEHFTYEYHYKNKNNGSAVEFKITSCG